MKINPDKLFGDLGMEKVVMHYEYGDEPCYRSKDGQFCRLDHFDGTYVIEYAVNEKEARLNWFEDGNRYDDDLPEEQLIIALQDDIRREVTL